MGFITMKDHYLGEHFWNFFQASNKQIQAIDGIVVEQYLSYGHGFGGYLFLLKISMGFKHIDSRYDLDAPPARMQLSLPG